MVHLESPVATKTFCQVNRTVKTLVAPTGNAVSGTGQMAGWGGQTFTLTGTATPFSNDYMTVHDVILWNPTGDGRANLSQLKTDGAMKDYALNEATQWWHFGPGPIGTGFTSHADIHSPILDPDVRTLYPNSPCRTTDAKLVVDVNMGGGAATIRAAPFTKDMCKMTPAAIRDHLLADHDIVSVIDIGGGGSDDKRIAFPKWVQSRRAVGEFTVSKLNLPLETQPTDGETQSVGMAALYTDEFCYGGWVFIFENIAPATYGSVPYIRMASAVEIQVQLSLGDNHLKERGEAYAFAKYLRDHEQLTGTQKPVTLPVKGSPVDEALKKTTPAPTTTKPKTKGRNGGGRTVAPSSKGSPTFMGPPGHARKGPNMRGSLPQQQQQQKSNAAKQNRAMTKEQVNKLAEQVLSKKHLTAWQQLGALFGGSSDPPRVALKNGY